MEGKGYVFFFKCHCHKSKTIPPLKETLTTKCDMLSCNGCCTKEGNNTIKICHYKK